MHQYNIHEAKTNFSKILNFAINGEEIIIANAGKPIARISPIIEKPKRKFGVLKGKIKIADDFDAPLPDDILRSFEGL